MDKNLKDISNMKLWWLAIRPKTLTAALSPVLVGWGLAAQSDQFHWGAAGAALFGAIMIQIGTNLVNDVVDFAKGADTEERLGPTRVTQSGLMTKNQVWWGVWVSFGLAVLAGLYLTYVAGWPVVVIGLASILAGILYTAGPISLAYIGLGDLFVMIFFGFVAVGGTVFVVSGDLSSSVWWLSAAVGALTVNILVINNIRDIEADRKAGRKNIPIIWGRSAAEFEYTIMILLAYMAPVILVARQDVSVWALLVFLSLPQAIKLNKILRSGLEGPPLNPILGQTAQLLFKYCILLALGLAL